MCMREPQADVRRVLLLSVLFFETECLRKLGAHCFSWTGWPGRPWGQPGLPPRLCQDHTCKLWVQFSHGPWGSELRPSFLHTKHFIHGA